jgi:hypothetical protein
MLGYKLDKYSNQHMANNFSEDFHFHMKDFNFIPSLEIKLLSGVGGESSLLDDIVK